MEILNKFVSSRGLLKSAKIRNKKPRSGSGDVDPDFKELLLQRPDTIYVNTDAIDNFSANYLEYVDFPFTLLTGDSDTLVDQGILDRTSVKKIIKSPFLKRWYAQNLESESELIKAMPIGNDYHTMWDRPGLWGLGRASPMLQEFKLLEILKASRPISQRLPLGYCNWHFHIDRGDRRDCKEKVSANSVFYEPFPLPRFDSWARQSDFLFVVSPRGAGIDCHRTWEALMLCQIPILSGNGLSGLFDGLPVCFVERWELVTRNYLQEFAEQNLNRRFNFSKLFLRYWTDKFQGHEFKDLDGITLSQFRDLMTSNVFY